MRLIKPSMPVWGVVADLGSAAEAACSALATGAEQAALGYVFSPGIWWSGLRVNRWGSSAHALQMN
jgi:hypothetical protein